MTDPLVSIVITNYEYSKYLSIAIKSLVKQNYKNIEILIIDDFSQDCSIQLINKLKQDYQNRFNRFKKIFLSENGGVNRALNIILPKTLGEIVVMLDADDWLHPTHTSILVSALQEYRKYNAKIAFSYCDCYLVNEAGWIIQKGISHPFSASLCRTQSYIPRPSPVLRKVLLDTLPLDETVFNGSKHLMWKNIVNKGWEGVYISQPLFYYRMHNRNLSGIGNKVHNSIDNFNKLAILSGYWSIHP